MSIFTIPVPRNFYITKYNGSLEIIDYCNSGGFGVVYKAKTPIETNSQKIVALKLLNKGSSQSVDEWQKPLYREAHIWSRLNHPNVLPFLGVSMGPGSIPGGPSTACLVMPWLEDGSVLDYLGNNPKSWQEKLMIVCDIASGLAYIHSVGIIHGDMKPNNVLIDANGHAVICDFGLSNLANSHTGLSVPIYELNFRRHAPELLSEDDFVTTKASDVWAFACTAYEVFTGRVPYYRFTRGWAGLIKAIEGGSTPDWNDEDGNPLCDIPSDLRNWINKHWGKNPSERGDMEESAIKLKSYASEIRA